jgi:putative transposase
MDRDLNAAINIRRQALALQSVERKALAGASAPVKLASVKQKKHDLRRFAQICADCLERFSVLGLR